MWLGRNVNWCSKGSRPQKKFLKISLYNPEIPLLGIYLKERKSLSRKDTCMPMFTAEFTTKTWKQRKHPRMDEWIKEMWYLFAVEYFSGTKKKEILFVST